MALLNRLLGREQAQVAEPNYPKDLSGTGSWVALAQELKARPALDFQPAPKPARQLARSGRPRAKRAATPASCTVQLNVRVSPEMRDALHAIAAQQGVRLSDMIRPCLARLIRRHQQ